MPRRRSVVTCTDGEAGPVGAAIGGAPAGGDSGVSQMGLVGMLSRAEVGCRFTAAVLTNGQSEYDV